MSVDIVSALTRFGETLSDSNVDGSAETTPPTVFSIIVCSHGSYIRPKNLAQPLLGDINFAQSALRVISLQQINRFLISNSPYFRKSFDSYSEWSSNEKLKVLGTLNGVTLTLSELSRSGVGRAVRRLKSEPGKLGKKARDLVVKWKSLLDEHIKRENIVIETTRGSIQSSSRDTEHTEPAIQPSKKRKSVDPFASATVNMPTSSEVHHSHLESKKAKHKEEITKEIFTPPSLRSTSPRFESKCRQKKNIHQPTNDFDGLSGVNSIDASSGLSFEESLFMSAKPTYSKKSANHKHKKPKSCRILARHSHSVCEDFSEEILNSLRESVERPLVLPTAHANNEIFGGHSREIQDQLLGSDDDGNLKFKSKKIMWAPRVKKTVRMNEKMPMNQEAAYSTGISAPPSLINLCLEVIEKNIALVDHVGLVPYELFERVLAKASARDLARIEKENPQFEGLTDELWRRHVQRDFPELKNASPRHNETWYQMHSRLVGERSKRLDRFINRSTTKLRAEKELRRTTLTTDVIVPAQIRKRAAREANHRLISNRTGFGGRSSQSQNHHRQPSSAAFLKPRNMSRPSPPHSSVSASSRHTVVSSDQPIESGTLLGKLKKQFLKGR